MSALKVLIFEYDRPFADALERAFARRGCSVRVVDDGQVGLDVALDDRPGLIILAIELPRMNGFAVCNRIKKHPDLKDIPLVIVSSDSPPETFEQHSKLRTRAEDYAHKPIDPEALIARAAAFVDIPSAHDSEIVVDDEAIEEAIEEAPINLDDDMGGLSDAAFDNIVLESNPPRPMPDSAASLLEPLPEPRSGRLASPQITSDDFEDYTMVSSAAELPLNFNDIARAVQANPLPPVSTPPAVVAPPQPPAPAVVVPPMARGSAPSLPRVGVAPPMAPRWPLRACRRSCRPRRSSPRPRRSPPPRSSTSSGCSAGSTSSSATSPPRSPRPSAWSSSPRTTSGCAPTATSSHG
ncbi:MAG: response regulator [Deltaproteobacteria bacterium]|nr:response regulator [Deltaproteobacteria bacterium]